MTETTTCCAWNIKMVNLNCRKFGGHVFTSTFNKNIDKDMLVNVSNININSIDRKLSTPFHMNLKNINIVR